MLLYIWDTIICFLAYLHTSLIKGRGLTLILPRLQVVHHINIFLKIRSFGAKELELRR